jgi:hypothetical protein
MWTIAHNANYSATTTWAATPRACNVTTCSFCNIASCSAYTIATCSFCSIVSYSACTVVSYNVALSLIIAAESMGTLQCCDLRCRVAHFMPLAIAAMQWVIEARMQSRHHCYNNARPLSIRRFVGLLSNIHLTFVQRPSNFRPTFIKRPLDFHLTFMPSSIYNTTII